MQARRLEGVSGGDVLIELRFEAVMIQRRYTLHFTGTMLTVEHLSPLMTCCPGQGNVFADFVRTRRLALPRKPQDQ